MIPEKYKYIMDLVNWVFNVTPSYYYFPYFTGHLIIKTFKGTEECELLFFPKRGVLMSFGKQPSAESCANIAGRWCLLQDCNRFLPSSTDMTQDQLAAKRKKEREKKEREKLNGPSMWDLSKMIGNEFVDFSRIDEEALLSSDLDIESNSIPIPKMASISSQTNSIAIFEDMRNGEGRRLIFNDSGTSFVLTYHKKYGNITINIKRLEGPEHKEIKSGTYIGSPVLVSHLLRDIPRVLQSISYNDLRLANKVVWR